MNINDFQPLLISFKDMFELQRELKFKFEPQAEKDFKEFDLDVFESQEVIKKYAWRITEELTEMIEAYYKDAQPGEKEHVYEEAIDAFNFFLELCNLVGYTEKNFEEHKVLPENVAEFNNGEYKRRCRTTDPEECATQIVFWLGMTCNHLKSREWRHSQYLVDVYKFWPDFIRIWDHFMILFHTFGWDSHEVARYYSLKYQVNMFRITTSY